MDKIPYILLCFFIFFFLFKSLYIPLPNKKRKFILYSEEGGDDLKYLYAYLLKTAKKSIFLSSFGLSDEDIKNIIAYKKARGVNVIIFNSKQERKKRKKVSGIYHRKILIIDNKMLFLGSANCSQHSLSFQGNHIIGIYHRPLINAIIKNISYQDEMLSLYLLPEEKKNALAKLIHTIDTAKSNITISMYALSHKDIIDSIVRAHKRGVPIFLYLDNSMMKLCRKQLAPLLDCSIPIATRIRAGLLHHKSALIDDTYIFGSTNWSKAGFSKNEETLVFLHDIPKELKKSIQKQYRDIKYFSINPILKNN